MSLLTRRPRVLGILAGAAVLSTGSAVTAYACTPEVANVAAVKTVAASPMRGPFRPALSAARIDALVARIAALQARLDAMRAIAATAKVKPADTRLSVDAALLSKVLAARALRAAAVGDRNCDRVQGVRFFRDAGRFADRGSRDHDGRHHR